MITEDKTIHELKIQEDFANAVYGGDKTFELRYNDRGYQKGDLIKFQAIDNIKCKTYHPINDLLYEITYVINGWGLKEEYVAFAIKEVTKNEQSKVSD